MIVTTILAAGLYLVCFVPLFTCPPGHHPGKPEDNRSVFDAPEW